MHSFTTLVLAAASVAGLASAQYSINPDSVPLATRQNWCQSQEAQCPLICLQYPGNSAATDDNTCDSTVLSYGCVCSNGQSPNVSEYSQTLPYFVCTEWGNQCVSNCGQDNSCSNDCRANHPCGALDPKTYNTSTVSSTMSKTSAPAGATTGAEGTVYTGFGGAAATTTAASGNNNGGSSSSAASAASAALQVGQAYGLVIVAAGLLGGFAILL